MKKHIISRILLGVLICTLPLFAANPPATVPLAWDQSSSANVDYLVYTGTATGVYTSSNNVGVNLNTIIGNLTRGQAYFFAVSAKFNTNAAPDQVGLESDLSNEVSYTPPAVPGTPPNLRIPSN